jgi:C4-dicarboxylate transporter, DctQ subunit
MLKRLEEHIAGLLLLFIALFMFYQVLSRYLFHHSLSYAEEVVRYLFIWSSMLGISAAFLQKAHLSVNLLPLWFHKRFVRFHQWLILTGALFFAGLLVYHGTLSVILQWKTHQTSAALGWPIVWVTSAIPVGGVLILIRLFQAEKDSVPTAVNKPH